MAEKRTCPVMECRAEIPAGYLMCRQHWALVPRPTRRAVNAAARGDDETTWISTARRALQEAHDKEMKALP